MKAIEMILYLYSPQEIPQVISIIKKEIEENDRPLSYINQAYATALKQYRLVSDDLEAIKVCVANALNILYTKESEKRVYLTERGVS